MRTSQPISINWRKDRIAVDYILKHKQGRKSLRTLYSESWLSFIPVLFYNVKCSLPDYLKEWVFLHNSLGISHNSSEWKGKKNLRSFIVRLLIKGEKKDTIIICLKSPFKPIQTVTRMNWELLFGYMPKKPIDVTTPYP